MKNTRSLTVVVLGLLVAGCAPDMQSLIITGVFPPDKSDKLGVCLTGSKPAVAQYNGSLNVGLSHTYYSLFTMDSLLEDNALAPKGNIAVITEIDYAYTASPGPVGTPVGFPSTETATISFTVQPATKDNLVLVDLIGPQASVSLDAVPAGTYNDYFNLKVQVTLKGQLVSGGPVQSNRIAYPIAIYNVGSSCSAGQLLKPDGPCGNTAQDGTPVVCCTPDPMTGLCQ